MGKVIAIGIIKVSVIRKVDNIINDANEYWTAREDQPSFIPFNCVIHRMQKHKMIEQTTQVSNRRFVKFRQSMLCNAF